jgi:nitrite reductase/ring-hydroxylating ferredoxin subunit
MAGCALEMVTAADSRQTSMVEVCGVAELWDGEMACFRIGDETVLLLKRDGQFHAYQGHCPHQGAPLVEGEFDGEFLTCRAHRWQFDAAKGQGVNPKNVQLTRFPTHVVESKVLIEVNFPSGNAEPAARSACVRLA